MVTLNELLDIAEVGSYTIYLITDREHTEPRARLEVPADRLALMAGVMEIRMEELMEVEVEACYSS